MTDYSGTIIAGAIRDGLNAIAASIDGYTEAVARAGLNQERALGDIATAIEKGMTEVAQEIHRQ